MKVLKFGGTSVGSPERMMQVADIIAGVQGKKIVVLSAGIWYNQYIGKHVRLLSE